MISRDPIDTSDDAGGRAGATTIEHSHGNEPNTLRDAIRRAADSAGDVRPVAIAIRRVSARGHLVDAGHGTTTELDVIEADARVVDVCGDAGTCRCVRVRTAERQGALVNAVEAPRGIRLRRDRVHHLILLDVDNLRISSECRRS